MSRKMRSKRPRSGRTAVNHDANLISPSRLVGLALVGLIVLASSQPLMAQAQKGFVSVRSGDTFRMAGSPLDFRLLGIEACELRQIAHLEGIAWPCGAVSTGWLTQLTLGYEIEWIEERQAEDLYATMLVRCFLPSGENIARLALAEGMVWLAYEDGMPMVQEYISVEENARNRRRGIWSSNFILRHQLYRP